MYHFLNTNCSQTLQCDDDYAADDNDADNDADDDAVDDDDAADDDDTDDGDNDDDEDDGRNLGKCDSYLQNMKILLFHSLSLLRYAIASKN